MTRPLPLALALVVTVLASACSQPQPQAPPASTSVPPAPKANVTTSSFGKLPDGTAVDLFTLTNAKGTKLRVTNYGGIITSLEVADRKGQLGDVVLGHETLEGYVKAHPYFGAIVGRYGNRIAKGRFTIDETTYKLAVNNGPNHLHGGLKGFDKVVWKATPFERAGEVGVIFTHVSPDGDEGYPGRLDARRDLCAERRQRAGDRLPREDGQSDARQSDAALVLQPGGRRLGRRPWSRADAERRSVHAGRCDADSDRRRWRRSMARRSTSGSRRRSARASTPPIRRSSTAAATTTTS